MRGKRGLARLRVHVAGFLLLTLGLAMAYGLAVAQTTDWAALIRAAKPAVVWVLAETAKGTSAGSGAIVSPDGYILTAAHVIEGATRIKVVVEETREFWASVVNADYKADVAVLKIPATGLTWFALGDSDKVAIEDQIRVLGYPLPGAGVGLIAVAGVIQGTRIRDGVKLLQHNAVTAPGHSGGPVINAQGQVIGVHSARLADQPEYRVAVAVNEAKRLIPWGTLPSGPSPVGVTARPGQIFPPIRVPQDASTLAEALARVPPGGVIELSPGKYKRYWEVTRSVTIRGQVGRPQDVLLEGVVISGDQSVVVVLDSLTLINDVGELCVVVEGAAHVKVLRSSTAHYYSRAVLSARDSARLTVEDCSFTNAACGLELSGQAEAEVRSTRFEDCTEGVRVGDSAVAELVGNFFYRNEIGVFSLSKREVRGQDNVMRNNRCDLVGNVSGGLRKPLRTATEAVVVFPAPAYPSLQHAVDALLPGGRLVLASGTSNEGVTIAKEIVVEAKSPEKWVSLRRPANAPVFSVVNGGCLRLSSVRLSDLSIVVGGTGGVFVTEARVYNAPVEMHGRSLLEASDSSFSRIRLLGSSRMQLDSCKVDEVKLLDGTTASLNNCTVDELFVGGFASATMTDCKLDSLAIDDRGRVELSGCTLHSYSDPVIRAKGLSRLFMRECAVLYYKLASTSAVELEEMAYVELVGSEVVCGGIWWGLYLSGSSSALVRDCQITGATSAAITVHRNATLTVCATEIAYSRCGIFSFTQGFVSGCENHMHNNAIDLVGNCPSGLRRPLVRATETAVRYPNERYRSLQEAVDSLVPGGELRISAGQHRGGVTIDKAVVLRSDPGAELFLPDEIKVPVISVVGTGSLEIVGLALTGGSCGLIFGANAEGLVQGVTFTKADKGVLEAISKMVRVKWGSKRLEVDYGSN